MVSDGFLQNRIGNRLLQGFLKFFLSSLENGPLKNHGTKNGYSLASLYKELFSGPDFSFSV